MTSPSALRPAFSGLLASACWLLVPPIHAADPAKPANEKIREVAGTAEVLRAVPKDFAILTSIDRANRRVTLTMEGENAPKSWPLLADAEIKLAGWWGRIDQLQIG